MRDVHRQCSLCGHQDGQRFFDEVPTHSFGGARLQALVASVRDAPAWPCPQCDEPLRPLDGLRHVLHVPVRGGQAILSAFAEAEGDAETVHWQAFPHRPLDVQMQAIWRVEEDTHAPVFDDMSVDAFVAAFGHPPCHKEGLRLALVRYFEQLASAAPAAPSPSSAPFPGADKAYPDKPHILLGGESWGVVLGRGAAPDDDAVRSHLRSLAPLTATWEVAWPLRDGALDDAGPGSASEWLADLPASFRAGWWLASAASPGAVVASLEAQLVRLPVQCRLRPAGDGDGHAFRIEFPQSDAAQPPIDPREVAREAARTLLHPETAARLELDRLLLYQAGDWSELYSESP